MDEAQKSGATVDVAEFIDGRPVGGFQIRLLLACAAVLFLDGFDTQAIGYVAPALAKEWGLTKPQLGPVFSAGLFGLMIGALLLGPLADRVGRRTIIILSTLAFGLGALATVFATGPTSLLAIRFLTGLGLGGAMPNAIALTSEFNPQRRRATMVMIMFAGFSVGAALGGLLAAAVIPHYGWRAVFVVGGIAPLVMVPILALRLPESVRFLTLSGRAPEQVADLLRSIAPDASFAPGARFVVTEPHLTGLPVLHLFREGRTAVTLLLWVVFFMSLLDIFFLANWLPTVLNDLGASESAAALIGSMLQVGGILGTFVLGSLIDRFSYRAMALVYFAAVFAVGAIGQVGHSAVLASVAIFAAGFCVVGGQIGANALAASFYPTAVRSTGVGWALGIGRIGSIVGPLVGGLLLAQKWSVAAVFFAAAAAALCASVASFFLARLVRPGNVQDTVGQPTSLSGTLEAASTAGH